MNLSVISHSGELSALRCSFVTRPGGWDYLFTEDIVFLTGDGGRKLALKRDNNSSI